MRIKELTETIALPDGVSASYAAPVLTVKGAKGELSRKLFHPRIAFTVEGNAITLTCTNAGKREKTLFYTLRSHVRNMVTGVTEGFVYKMKVCSGHFPMTVTVKGELFEVKNFIGEAVPRTLKLNPAVKVTVEGADVTLEGTDVEAVGNQAGSIEQLTRRLGFDRRIFQDGIYITNKAGDEL